MAVLPKSCFKMSFISQRRFRSAIRRFFLVGLALWTIIVGGTVSAVEVTETGLHSDAEPVIGEDASGLGEDFISNADYSVTAEGDISEAYADASAFAFGIYTDPTSLTNISATGGIEVFATGGAALSESGTAEADAGAWGIYAYGNVVDSGGIAAMAVGGTASSNGTDANADALAFGIDAYGDVENNEAITAIATSGTAEVYTDIYEYYVNAIANACGIRGSGNLKNSGAIASIATGGSATADSSASAGDVYADAYAYGIYIVSGEVENSGMITATAVGGAVSNKSAAADAATAATGNADAFGILSFGDVENNGAITTIAEGATAESYTDASDCYAASIANASGIKISGTLKNSGTITAIATGGTASSNSTSADIATIAAAHANANGLRSRDVENSGAIMATATGGTASSTSYTALAHAAVYGISPTGILKNSGAITAMATGGNASSDTGYAYADAFGSGIYAYYGDDFTNSGAIAMAASGGSAVSGTGIASASVNAYGIEVESGNIQNSNTIMVTATGGSAVTDGIASVDVYVDGLYAHEGNVENSGDITITATGGSASSGAGDADADVYAGGIYTYVGDVKNSGNITVTATGGTASSNSGNADAYADAAGIYVCNTSDVNNSGNISITATTESGFSSYAAGIYFYDGGTLTNTGAITANADEMYQVAVKSGTLTLMDRYNLNLSGNAATGAIYVGEDATLEINGTQLTVSTVDGNVRLGNEYRIFETEETAVVSGTFGGIGGAANPNVTVAYHDQATVGADDDTVSIDFTPTGSTFLESIDFLRRNLTLAGSVINQQLATGYMEDLNAEVGAGDTGAHGASVNGGNGLFLAPYYTRLDEDTNPVGYEADTKGILGGYDRYIRNALYGLHAGWWDSEMTFSGPGFNADEEHQEVLTVGLHGMGSFSEEWTWRSEVTCFSGSHTYTGRTGLNLDMATRAEYDSKGVSASLTAGRLLRLRNGHVLLPEIGMEYLYVDRDGFTTEAESSAWDVSTDAVRDNQVMAAASLRWLKPTTLWGIRMTPSASASLRCLLTDKTTAETQSAGSTATHLQMEQDEVSGTTSASLLFRGKRISTEIAYAGEFSDQTRQHTISLRFSSRF